MYTTIKTGFFRIFSEPVYGSRKCLAYNLPGTKGKITKYMSQINRLSRFGGKSTHTDKQTSYWYILRIYKYDFCLE